MECHVSDKTLLLQCKWAKGHSGLMGQSVSLFAKHILSGRAYDDCHVGRLACDREENWWIVVNSSISFLQRFTNMSMGPNTVASLASKRPPA